MTGTGARVAALFAGLLFLGQAACGQPPAAGRALASTTRLLPLLEEARWHPDVINLNQPSIDSLTVDLGDGPCPALLEHPVASVTWALELRVPLKLVTAVGLQPAAWDRSADGASFAVDIDDGHERRRLFMRRVDPRRLPGDRGWTAVQIDLRPWAGKTVRLTLSTGVGPGSDPTYDWALWRDPTLEPI